MKNIPDIIKENGFDFSWDNKKVWNLELPVEEIDIQELEWILDLPFWNTKGNSYDLSAREVLTHPEMYPYHTQRINKSDTTYPIDIMKNKKGKWLILDGLHRLVKLLSEGRVKILVRKVPKELLHLIKTEY